MAYNVEEAFNKTASIILEKIKSEIIDATEVLFFVLSPKANGIKIGSESQPT